MIRYFSILLLISAIWGCADNKAGEIKKQLGLIRIGETRQLVMTKVSRPLSISSFAYKGENYEVWAFRGDPATSTLPQITFDSSGKVIEIIIDETTRKGGIPGLNQRAK